MSISIRFLRRRNLGNFEHTELEITDSVQDKVDLGSAINSTMAVVKDALYQTGAFAPGSVFKDIGGDEVVTTGPVTSAPAKEKTAPVTKVKTAPAAKVEAPANTTEKTVEAPVTENKPQEEVKVEAPAKEEPANAAAEVKTAPVAEVKPTVTKKSETKIVTKPTKVSAYDRTLNPHKSVLGAFLNSKFPNWRTKEVLEKCGIASRALQGSEFLDAEGNILESFKEAFSKYLA